MASGSTLFPVQTSRVDLAGKLFRQNEEDWKPVLERFEQHLKQISSEGDEVSLKRHQSRGQLLRALHPHSLQRNRLTLSIARDRIALLLDHDSPFLELGAFAGFGNPNSTPSGNLIAGIGNVSGRPCMLMSHIPTQSGGAWNEMTGKETMKYDKTQLTVQYSAQGQPDYGSRV
jgi:acetyl-CoA carboxylase carboxyltransferase component